MNSFLFVISLVLLIAGMVGVIRGRIDTRICRTRSTSLIPLVVGAVLMFATSAPPLMAAGSVGGTVSPPTPAAKVMDNLEPVIRRGTEPADDLQPEQTKAFPQWERQVMAAHKKADEVLSQVSDVMAALDDGKIDRFTAWTRLGILSEDLRQSKLLLHDLTPPMVLNLADQRSLESGLNDLRESLSLKRDGIQALRAFVSTADAKEIERARSEMDKGHDSMVTGLSKLARVKARLAVTA